MPQKTLKTGLVETIAWYKAFFSSGVPVVTGGFKPPEALHY
jgi:hypothetical protein